MLTEEQKESMDIFYKAFIQNLSPQEFVSDLIKKVAFEKFIEELLQTQHQQTVEMACQVLEKARPADNVPEPFKTAGRTVMNQLQIEIRSLKFEE